MNTPQSLTPFTTEGLRPEPAQVGAGSAVDWIKQGWKLFKGNAVMWIALLVVLFVIIVVLAFIPILGGLALTLLMPVFMAGLFTAAQAVESGAAPTFDHLFSAFKDKFKPLVIVGALQLAVYIVVGLVLFAVLSAVGAGSAAMGDYSALGASAFLLTLVSLPIFLIVGAVFAYSPALVSLQGVEPVGSLKLGLKGSLRNWLPLLVFGILSAILGFIGMIPFGLGLLVVYPVLMLAFYSSYKAIFVQG